MIPLALRTGLAVRLWRRRWLFAAVFGSVLAIAVAALFVLPTQYVASGSVIVAEQEPAAATESAAWAQKIGDPADLESQLLLIRSPRIIRAAMAMPGVPEGARADCEADARSLVGRAFRTTAPRCDDLQAGSDKLLNYLSERYSVGMMGRSRVISVAYPSSIPAVAQTMANALVNAFLDDQKESMSSTRETAASYLWQEVHDLERQLATQDGKIQDFRRAHGLLRGAQAPIASEQLTAINQQLSSAMVARADAAAHLREILAAHEKGAGDAPAVLASRSVADLKQQIATVGARLASAATTLGPNHPAIQALQHERSELDKRMASEVGSIVESARKTYASADALVTSLQAQMAAAGSTASTATDAEATLANMIRESEIKRSQYVDLFKQASELETQRRVLIGNTRLVSLAELPEKPFFPRKIPFLAAGLTVATLLAAAAALLRDRADGSVRAGSTLALATGVPILAQLPQVRPAGGSGLVTLLGRGAADPPLRQALREGGRSAALQDGLRALFARLALSADDGRSTRILVTSDAPQEGKTFTTLSLARLIAASGRRVLVIEGDLRNPSIEAALGLETGPGLGAILRGTAAIQDAVIATSMPTLTIIPAGEPVDDSTELLIGGRLRNLIRWSERFDFVLVDSPPASLLPDASILAKHVDGVLVCTRWGRSQMAATEATVAALAASATPVLGLAVTMVETDSYPLYETRPLPTTPYLGTKAA